MKTCDNVCDSGADAEEAVKVPSSEDKVANHK